MASFITQEEIAKKLGIGRSTVGAALNPRLAGTLRKSLRERILKAAKKFGYQPNHYARIMRYGKSQTIGLLDFNSSKEFNTLLFQAVQKRGYKLLASDVLWFNLNARAAWETLLEAKIEGVILANPSVWFDKSILREIRHLRIPSVSISGVHFPGILQVRSDLYFGMRILTKHLLEAGYRDLLMVAYWPYHIHSQNWCWTILERMKGFKDAIAEYEKEHRCKVKKEIFLFNVPGGDYWSKPFEPGRLATFELLDNRKSLPEVIVYPNDKFAFGGLSALSERSIRVPDDVAIVGGGDNEPFSEYGTIPLTTLSLRNSVMVDKAVELLINSVKSKRMLSSQIIKVPMDLIVRKSCGTKKMKGKRK